MKISIMTDQLGLTLEEALRRIRVWEVSWVDLRGQIFGTFVDQLTVEQARHAWQWMREQGLQVACLAARFASPWQAAGLEVPLEEDLKHLEHLITLTRVFQTDYIRVYAYQKPNPSQPLDRPNLDSVLERIAARLRSAAQRAADHGLILVLENEPPSYVGTAKELRQVLETVDHPALRACWDVANGWACGEFPYPEGYSQIKGQIGYVHIKGAKSDPDRPSDYHSVALLGDDDLPWEQILSALAADGYQGKLALHPHHNLFAPDCRLSVENPDLEAARLTLERLRRLLARLDSLATVT